MVRLYAHPVLMDVQDFPKLINTYRKDIVAINGQNYKSVPIQIEEVESGSLVFRNPQIKLKGRASFTPPEKQDPFKGKIKGKLGDLNYSIHRFIVDDEDFSTCDDKCQQNQQKLKEKCPLLYSVKLKFSQKSIFIGKCPSFKKKFKQFSLKTPIKSKKFKWKDYSYEFSGENNVLLNNLKIKSNDIFKNGQINGKLLSKFLFASEFTHENFQTPITGVTSGPVGTGVEFALSLNLLGMKISDQICCDLTVYDNALYFPIVIDFPFEGKSFQKGSGLLYGFNYGDSLSRYKFDLPRWSKDKPRKSGSIVWSKDNDRVFMGFRPLKGTTGIAPFKMEPDDWEKLGYSSPDSDFGLFYDVTQMDKALHVFSVWIYTGKAQDENKLKEYVKNGIEYQTTNLSK